MKLGEE